MIQPYIARDSCFRATRLLINRVTCLKTGIPYRRLMLANDPLGEWVRGVHPGEQTFCHKSSCPRLATSLISFDIVKVMHCVSVALSNRSQTCRLGVMGQGQRIGVRCIRPHEELG